MGCLSPLKIVQGLIYYWIYCFHADFRDVTRGYPCTLHFTVLPVLFEHNCLYIANGERCIESMQPLFWLFNMTSKFLFYTSLMCSHVPPRFSWKISPSFTVCVFRRVSRGVQAVALLVMMPVFTFMGIKVSVLAGYLRGEAMDWDFASVCIKFWKIALRKADLWNHVWCDDETERCF